MTVLKTKAILFDMDGVITDTMPYHFRAWRKAFEHAGFAVSQREVFLREGQSGRRTVREIFCERKIPFSSRVADEILKDKERIFKTIVRKRFVRGSRSFLRRLRAQGMKLALVTGTSRHEAREILPESLYRLFCVTITSDEVRVGKPDPEPYLLALEKLGLRPTDAVVIENAPFGITSAKRAGLRCIALTTSLPKAYLKDADLTFASFAGLNRKVRLLVAL